MNYEQELFSLDLRAYGYAHGYYSIKCHSCGNFVDYVDKRCTTCFECAERLYNKDRQSRQEPQG